MKTVDVLSLRFGRELRKSPPLGALSLCAVAEKMGWEWILQDCQFNPNMTPFSLEALADLLLRSRSEVIAISLFNDALPLVLVALEKMRTALCGRKIFLGGPGVVGVAKELLKFSNVTDAVVVGEGETAFAKLLGCFDVAPELPGVYYKNQDGSVSGAGTTIRESLDDLPTIPWDWCTGKGYSTVPLSTARGCPFDCTFCEIIAFMGRRVTFRSLELVKEDLVTALAAIGTNRVEVYDDTFTVNRRRVFNFCEMVSQGLPEIEYSVYSRIDTIDRSIMEALRNSGCRRVFFGIDSGDNSVLNRISKRIQRQQAEAVIAESAEFFDVTASFIWGYPFETMESFLETMAFAESLMRLAGKGRVQPQLHLLSPSAGTPLFVEFGNCIEFDESIETSTCGTIAGFYRQKGFNEIIDFIRKNPILSAPFYRYETPSFAEKRLIVEDFNKSLDSALGDLVQTLYLQ